MSATTVRQTADGAARAEWRAHWALVLSAMIGLSFATVPTATLGLFMEPLGSEFGWSRTQISAGLSIFALVSLPLTPFVGVLADRLGSRRLAVPGLALSGAAFAAFGLLQGSLVQWYGTWLAVTLASLLIRSLVWNTAVSKAFFAARGLAVALVLCGTAIAQSAGPLASSWLIGAYGWRGAYLAIALGWGGLALVLAILFFRERRRAPEARVGESAGAPDQTPGGLSVRSALRSFTLYRIAIAIFVQATMGVAVLVHLVPMLTEHGLSRAAAAGIAAVLGIASIVGKVVTGYLTDRIEGSALPVICFAGPALGHLLLLQGSSSAWLLSLAVFILGYCSGASLQLVTYLTSRYAGMRNFGAIFGLVSTVMAVAAGLGPVIGGQVFDLTGSYRVLLAAGIVLSALAGLAVFRLGKYPEFPAGSVGPHP